MLPHLVGLFLVLALPSFAGQKIINPAIQDTTELDEKIILEDQEWDALLEDLTDFEAQDQEIYRKDSTEFKNKEQPQEMLEGNEKKVGTIEVYQDPKLSKLLEKEKEYAPSLRKPKEQTIQIASGNNLENVKERCEKSEKILGKPCQIKYESPNYKCWCGQYKDELSAERDWELFKMEFPGALLINIK